MEHRVLSSRAGYATEILRPNGGCKCVRNSNAGPSLITVQWKLTRLCMRLLFRLTPSSKRIVAQVYCSKWATILKPHTAQVRSEHKNILSSSCTRQCLHQLQSYPTTHLTDNGHLFNSKEFADYSYSKETDYKTIYPYHPQAERVMKQLGKALKAAHSTHRPIKTAWTNPDWLPHNPYIAIRGFPSWRWLPTF